ncbi:MAG: signal peptide peptidase SppA [Duncaniella sp.]|nr:signal peptide peptidase SppA [Duncaniella sp.]
MKKFLLAFLGTMAALWVSLFIGVIGLIITIAAVGLSQAGSSKSGKIERHSYLEISLVGTIEDRPGTVDPIGLLQGDDSRAQGLDQIIASIDAAAGDKRIEGVSLQCTGAVMGTAMRQSLVEALQRFKEQAPGKWVVAYADTYTQGDYYVAASVADSLFVNPVGLIDIHGLQSTGLYFKSLLDRLGVQMQVVKVGTYKSAVEPFILDGISEPAREQQQLYLNNIWDCVAQGVARGRNVSVDTVNMWADGYIFALDASRYVEMKIADGVKYRHEYDEMLASLSGRDKVQDLRPVSPAEYCAATPGINKHAGGKGAKIGVLYACGDITDAAGEGIVADKMVPMILDLADDDDLDALVMYVNSGGGSAYASEQIWEALQQWKEITGKPLYVSMGDYAASGGYYISCGADRIYAQPTTLTGSIGIFGLIPDAKTLINDKLGVHTSTVSTHAGASMPTLFEPMTPAQRAAMQSYVDRGYELFTSRCAQGRGISQDSIKSIAEGRVWDGREALRLGLVDELGGLDAAVTGVAQQLGVSSWTVEQYPKRKDKWYDLLIDAGVEMRASWVRAQLGEMASLYDVMQRVKGMSTVQARMDFQKVEL